MKSKDAEDWVAREADSENWKREERKGEWKKNAGIEKATRARTMASHYKNTRLTSLPTATGAGEKVFSADAVNKLLIYY